MGKKEKTGKKGGENDDVKRDQKLQAILLAVSFTKYFRPISYIKPKVMLPLVNVPMLMYTIEFLAQNGVEEIFVFCVRHADLIQDFINGLKLPSNLTVKCIFSRACLSQGDALRELDALGMVRSDPFILINGDVISNMDLKKAIAFHKSRRQEDGNCIMTCVLKQVQQRGAGVRPLSDDLVVGMDRHSGQLLLFDSDVSQSSVSVPAEIFVEHPGLVLRTDLLDCQIDICSPELLLQFSDNFDYQDIRKHFIKNEVVNWELGEHLYGYIIQDEYAAQVADTRTYHAICRDIVRRWVFPLVPDAHLLTDTSFVQARRHNYREDGVKVARSASIGEGVVLGRGAVIGEGAVVSRCVIGRNCSVGAGAVLRESHLWEGAIVEAGAKVTHSIVGERTIIKEGAVVERGCVLSSECVVGAGVTLREYTRVGSCRHPDEELSDDDDDDEEEGERGASRDEEFDTAVLGAEGRGFIWEFGDEVGDEFGLDEDDDEDDQEDCGAPAKSYRLPGGREAALRASSMGCSEQEAWKLSLWSVPDEVEEESEDESLGGMMGGEGDELFGGEADFDGFLEEGMGGEQKDASSQGFFKIVGEMVSTGFAEGHPADNLLMEIKGYKFAQNKEFADCLRGAVPALLTIVLSQQPSGCMEVARLVTSLKNMFGEDKWGHQLVGALLQEPSDRVSLIEEVEEWVLAVDEEMRRESGEEAGRHIMFTSFRFVLQILYDEDLLDEEAVLEWAHAKEGQKGNGGNAEELFLQSSVQQFVEWLRDQDDEDDSEDDDEDEDSS